MRIAPLALAALLVAPACGGAESGVSDAAAARLEPKVEAVRQAAADGSHEAATHELTDLRGLVDELSAAGELGDGGARRILAAAERVEANLALLATTTTTTPPPATTTTPPPPPPPPPPTEKEKEEKEEEEEEEEEEQTTTVPEDKTGEEKPANENGGKGKD